MKKLIQQYQQMKVKYPDAVLLFRVGDFYETFNEDAKTISEIMGIHLTETTNSEFVKVSASVPFQSLDYALQKLVKKGFRVAVCEELEDPKINKEIARRGVSDFL